VINSDDEDETSKPAEDVNDWESSRLLDLFKCISLCHNCTRIENRASDDSRPAYTGPSLDEECLLVEAHNRAICSFESKDSDHIRIRLSEGHVEEFLILKVFHFTSDRKAMSIAVKDGQGKVFLYTKGAESSIKRMLRSPDGVTQQAVLDDINRFARRGLRTLMYAMKELDLEKLTTDETVDWDNISAESVECGLEVLGGTGVEDSL